MTNEIKVNIYCFIVCKMYVLCNRHATKLVGPYIVLCVQQTTNVNVTCGIFFSQRKPSFRLMKCNLWQIKRHYKKSWLFKRLTWPKCLHWLKGMSILTKGLGHEKTCYIWLVHLTKVTFLTKYQVEDLVKMDKRSLKWSWLSQIGYIEWIGFSQIDHYHLTLSQMIHIHLMI
jgi:hypothetical protein